MNANNIRRLIENIIAQTEIDSGFYSPEKVYNEADLQQILEQIISYLTDTHFEKLLWLLYRIDVDEDKLKRILNAHSPAEAPALIARIIIERERQKELYRQTHKNIGDDNPERDEPMSGDN